MLSLAIEPVSIRINSDPAASIASIFFWSSRLEVTSQSMPTTAVTRLFSESSTVAIETIAS